MIEIYWIYDYHLSCLYDSKKDKLRKLLRQSLIDKIQLRIKTTDLSLAYQWCEETSKIIFQEKGQCSVVINDFSEIAYSLGLGLHLGKMDAELSVLRKRFPKMEIGYTCHSIQDIFHACKHNCSYIGIGTIFPSRTKPKLKAQGFKLLAQARRRFSSKKIYPVGGIDEKNFRLIFDLGIYSCALSSLFFQDDYLEKAKMLKSYC